MYSEIETLVSDFTPRQGMPVDEEDLWLNPFLKSIREIAKRSFPTSVTVWAEE
jgi:hypothetical protein